MSSSNCLSCKSSNITVSTKEIYRIIHCNECRWNHYYILEDLAAKMEKGKEKQLYCILCLTHHKINTNVEVQEIADFDFVCQACVAKNHE